jgi:hypothetical protein
MDAEVDAWLARVRGALDSGRDSTSDTTAQFPGAAEILATLPLRPRPGLYIGPAQGKGGVLLILEEPSDRVDHGADAIIGLAVPGVLVLGASG